MVGLTNKFVMSSPSTNLTLTSKKLIVFFEYSAVNFIVGGKVFNLLINFCRDSSPCSQMKNICVEEVEEGEEGEDVEYIC